MCKLGSSPFLNSGMGNREIKLTTFHGKRQFALDFLYLKIIHTFTINAKLLTLM